MCDEESRVFETSDITDKEYPEEARIQFSIKMGTPFFQTGTPPHEFHRSSKYNFHAIYRFYFRILWNNETVQKIPMETE